MTAGSPTSGFEQFVTFLHDFQATKYMSVAGQALYFYDVVLTASDEYRHVWKANWSLGKGLYLFARYPYNLFTFVHFAMSNLAPASSLTYSYCKHANRASGYGGWIQVLAQQAILAVRTAALYGLERSVVISISCMMFLCGTGLLALNIILNSRMEVGAAIPGSFIPGCSFKCNDCFTIVKLTLIPIIIFDLFLLVLTIRKHCEDSKLLRKMRSPLLRVLYRDGFLYFAVIISCAMINFMIYLTIRPSLMFLMDGVLRFIVTSMASRLLLNLRGVFFQRTGENQVTLHLNTFSKPPDTENGGASTGIGVWNKTSPGTVANETVAISTLRVPPLSSSSEISTYPSSSASRTLA